MKQELKDQGNGVQTRWIGTSYFQVITDNTVINIRPGKGGYKQFPGKTVDDIEIIKCGEEANIEKIQLNEANDSKEIRPNEFTENVTVFVTVKK